MKDKQEEKKAKEAEKQSRKEEREKKKKKRDEAKKERKKGRKESGQKISGTTGIEDDFEKLCVEKVLTSTE